MQRERWSTRHVLWNIASRFYGYIMGMACATILWAIDDSVVRPYLLKLLLDGMTERAGIDATKLYWRLLAIAGLYGAARLVVTLLVRWWDWLSVSMVPAIKAQVMEQLTARAISQGNGARHGSGTGALASSIHTAAEGFPQLIIPFVGRFLGSTCRVLFAVGMLWMTLLPAAVIMTVWVILFLGGGLWWAQASRRLADRASRTYADITGGITDILANIISVYLYNRHTYEMKLVQHWGAQWTTAERARDMALVKLYLVQGLSFFVLELLTVWTVVYHVAYGAATAGDAALVISINMVLLEALWDVPQEVTQFVRALGRVSQGIGSIMVPSMPHNLPGAAVLCVSRGAIVFDRVTFGYPGAPLLFERLSVQIPAGQRVGIVGYSGSGKTTLVQLLLRLHDIQRGAIMIDDGNIAQVTQESLHNAITLIPQDPSLFHRSVADNIRYGNTDASYDDIVRAAQYAHAHEFIVQMPGGYEAIVGEHGMYLSAGQRQRIAIARALLKNAPIIIMDEATSALDSATEQLLADAIQRLTAGKTTIIIAHRLSTLLHMDRILVCDKGKIVQDGTHATLIAQPGVYRDLWQLQVGQLATSI